MLHGLCSQRDETPRHAALGHSTFLLPRREVIQATSRSAVSRPFIALSGELLTRWLSRRLGDFDSRVVMIEGMRFAEHCILIALGTTADGTKRVLGLHEAEARERREGVWLRVPWRCWQDKKAYDPTQHRAARDLVRAA